MSLDAKHDAFKRWCGVALNHACQIVKPFFVGLLVTLGSQSAGKCVLVKQLHNHMNFFLLFHLSMFVNLYIQYLIISVCHPYTLV
jgi:hypothetical protein